MAVFLTCSSVSATAAPPAAYSQSGSGSAVLLADAAKPTAQKEAKSKEEAAKPVLTPVKVSVKTTEQNVEIAIFGKAAVLGGYNASLQKRTITVAQASLAGPEQNLELDKGLIKSVHVHELDGSKVVIDIYTLSNPRIVQQAQGKKFLVSLNDMEDASKQKKAAQPQTKPAPAAGRDKAAPKTETKPQAAAAPAKSEEKTGAKKAEVKTADSEQPAAAEKEAVPAPPPEPIPVTVKVSSGADSVSFDVNWSGDVKVKEFPYNPGKGMHTFVFSPAVLSAPEGSVAVSQGTLQTIRTRQIDKRTVAVDIMASSAPNVKAQKRQTPGASYIIRTAKAAAAAPKTKPAAAAQNKPAASPKASPAAAAKDKPAVPAAAADQNKPQAKPEAAKAAVPEKPNAAAAPAANVSSQTPAAAPKAASNVGAETNAAAKTGDLPTSERICDYFTMAGRDVQSLVNSMKGLFPNVRFQADPILNVILVEGPAKDIEEVRKLINVQ